MTIVHVNVNSYHDFSRLKYAQICWLVVSTPLKNMKVSWDDYSQYMGNKCSKPPTRDVHGYDVTSTDPPAFIHDEILMVAG